MLLSIPTNVQEYQQQKAAWNEIHQQISSDPKQREDLKSDPVKFLGQVGVKVPDGVKINVVEFDPNNLYLILPPMMPIQSGQDES
jgi:hypothetical protein